MPTYNWTELGTNSAIGDSVSSESYNALLNNANFLRSPPSFLYELSTAASNVTTTSVSFTPLGLFTGSLTTQGGAIEVHFGGRITGTTSRLSCLVDGIDITNDNDGFGASVSVGCIDIVRYVAVAAGAHTITMQWRSTSGTITLFAASAAFLFAREIGIIQ